jgi:putative transposase
VLAAPLARRATQRSKRSRPGCFNITVQAAAHDRVIVEVVGELIAKAAYPPHSSSCPNPVPHTRWKGYGTGKVSQIGVVSPPQNASGVLTEIVRTGSHKPLAAALEAEIEEFPARYAKQRDFRGRQRLVRSGSHRPPRCADWHWVDPGPSPTGPGSGVVLRGDRVHVGDPAAIPASHEDLLPWLYQKGVSTVDFGDALASLLGPDARGLSAPTISRLKQGWEADDTAWNRHDLSSKR